MDGVIYRPVWVCGRFDRESKTTIVFNLIEGKNYLFEDYSAIVTGSILELPRGGGIKAEDLAERTNISPKSLMPFLALLENKGLITFEPITDAIVAKYREEIKNIRVAQQTVMADDASFNNKNVERSYANRCSNRIISVLIELTYSCSEQCLHCYNPGATRNGDERSYRKTFSKLSVDEYKRIIDDLYDEGLVKVCLSGGDPFSYPHIWDLIEYIYEKDIVFEIYTNGQRLYGHEDRLSKYFPCDVGISIYSSEVTVHDEITRVAGSFEKSMSVIEKLFDYAIPIEIKCCVMRNNVRTYTGVADIAKRFGAFLQIECSIFDGMDGDKCVSTYLRLTKEQMQVVLRDPNNPLYVGKEKPNYGGIKQNLSENGCRAGNQSFCITPDGNLTPCPSFHATIGSLKESTLREILTKSTFLKWWNGLTVSEYEECGQHDYCDFCKLCPGLNFAEHGTPLKASENNCFTAKARKELAEMLKYGKDPLDGLELSVVLRNLDERKTSFLHKVLPTNSYGESSKIEIARGKDTSSE